MRFTTVDPLAEKYFSWSPYAYVANNPIKFIDPTGMSMDDYYVDKQGEILAQVKTNEEDRIIVNELDEVTVRPQGPIDYYSRGGVTRAYDINTGDDYGIVGETPLKTVSPEFDVLLIGRLAFNAASAATRQVAKETAADLSSDIAKTFSRGKYEKIILDQPMSLSRYYDNVGAFAKGRFMTNPSSISGFKFVDRMGLALKPQWNDMTKVAHWNLPTGTTIYKGRAAMQFPWIGGKTQYFIPNLNNINRVIKP